ncbi:MAG: YbgC/FadM family acyl-CoA thioesterase [Candidatus Omnitrophota bacterium]
MKEYSLTKKIYYHDTDCGGVIYYANYLEYLEEGRTEALTELGIGPKRWVDAGIVFVVAHVDIDYKAPGRYADTIKVISRIEKVGKTTIHFYQEVKKDETILVKANVVLACVGKDLKPKPIPEEIKKVLV